VTQKDAVFNLVNDSPGKHDFTLGTKLKGDVLFTQAVASNASAMVDLTFLAPGRYTYWCSMLDHADLGQVGTLTITP
jgi:plastocyanin